MILNYCVCSVVIIECRVQFSGQGRGCVAEGNVLQSVRLNAMLFAGDILAAGLALV